MHYLYVLPSDDIDERLDVNGAIANSVASIQTWLAGQTGGRRLRADTFNGQLDIYVNGVSRSGGVAERSNVIVLKC